MPVGRPRPRLLGADPINRGLVGFWPLSEGGGARAIDLSPNRYAGRMENSVGRPAASFGKATSYTGGGAGATNVNLGTLGPFYSAQTNWAVSAWVRPTSFATPGIVFSLYAGLGSGASQLAKLLYAESTTGVTTIYLTTSGGSYQGATGPAMSLNVWQHVGMSVTGPTSGPTVVIWVNNSTSSTVLGATGTPAAGMNHRIGSSDLSLSGSSSSWTGQIGPVRVWSRGILPGERQRLRTDPWAGIARSAMGRSYLAGPTPPIPPITALGSIVVMPPDFGYPQSITGSPPNPAVSV